MNIKNKNGVTIAVLVITIIVMIILFGVTYSTSTDLLKNSQRNKMKTMLYMVQSRAEILLDDYRFEYGEATDGNLNLLAGADASSTDLDKVGYSTGPKIIYRAWDENTLKNQGIDTENLAQGDKIIIQYDLTSGTVDVASTKGFSKDGTSIYKLKDF